MDQWVLSMDSEFNSLMENRTWVLVPRPSNANIVTGKWVYAIKKDESGKIIRYKSRWVARGFTQVKGLDYHEVFAPTVRSTSIRIILSIICTRGMVAMQYDVETAFLNGIIKEDIFMEQPTGYERGLNMVCKLKKSIYGLKQSGREWNTVITSFFKERNFRVSDVDTCLFFRRKEGKLTIVSIYVDDLIIAADKNQDIDDLVLDLKAKFKIKELGSLNFYLGIKIKRNDTVMQLSQDAYKMKILKKFEKYRYGKGRAPISKVLEKNKAEKRRQEDYPFQQILGSLMYLSTSTRPDITFAISFLSRRMKNPVEFDEKMLSGVLKYLEEIGDLELNYKRMNDLEADEVQISLYTDSDWGGDKEDCASTSGYLCFVNGNLISWRPKKQDRVAMSSTEAEYISLFHGVQEAIWVKQLLEGLNFKIKDNHVKVYVDNKGAISLAENAVYSPRTKHVDLKYHFTRQAVARGDIKIEYVNTDNMVADGLTKAIGGQRLEKLFAEINLKKAAS